ncbi:TonB-dependent siderophore receptor, partial [Jeongeupia chitinilytica]|uniref:TonB-dependent siderophore receptor n=1 Tax=Jeongeupia chitinilytica TaxID=1041641 RepID=UPI001679D6E0
WAVAIATAHAAPFRLDLPAQPLATSLTRLGQAAGLNLVVDSALVVGRQAPALRGTLEPAAALQQLLAGSGLSASFSGKTVTVGRSEATLSAVTVEAMRDWATSPGIGYQARHAASATKTDTTLRETPQSISVVTREQMDDQDVATIAEAVRYNAGVTAYEFATTDDDLLMRGFGVSADGMYRDGMRLYHNAFISRIEPYGLERLDIVRGPGSVLYGRANPGGLVNAVTKRPIVGLRPEVRVETGSYDRAQIAADVGGTLDDDGRWVYRLTALARDAGTQWDDLPDDRVYLAPALTWQPDARTSLTLLAQYQHDRTTWAIPNQFYQPGPLGQPDPSLNIQGPGAEHDKTGVTVGYLFEHAPDDVWTLRQNLRYYDARNDRREVRALGLRPDDRTLNRRALYRPEHEKSFAVDNQVQARVRTGAVEHLLLGGVDYRQASFEQKLYMGAAAPLDLYDPVFRQPDWDSLQQTWDNLNKSRQLGTYLQDQLRYGRWALTVGGRYDWTRDSADSKLDGVYTEQRDQAFTGRAGLVYPFDAGWAPYLSYSTSFKPEIGNDAFGQQFKPERGEQLEAGAKYQPEGASYSFTAAVYQLTKENVRTPLPGANPLRLEVQTGEVRSRGLELEGQWQLGALDLIGSYTFIDAEITRSNVAADVGKPPLSIPRHTAAAWGKYDFSGALAGWNAGLGVRYVGQSRGGLGTSNDAFTLVDSLIAYERADWRFALNVNNLFDREYLTGCDGTFCEQGFRRSIRASVGYRW